MIPGMGKDAPARPALQAEAEKVEKSPAQDKKLIKATLGQSGTVDKAPVHLSQATFSRSKSALREKPGKK